MIAFILRPLNTIALLIGLLTLVVGVSRLLLPTLPLDLSFMSIYKDMTHIFVGVLLGGWLLAANQYDRKQYAVAFVMLTIIETTVFLMKS